MLVLSRLKDESIIITTPQGDKIEIVITEVSGHKVRVGIEAARNISVHRKEVQDAIEKKNK